MSIVGWLSRLLGHRTTPPAMPLSPSHDLARKMREQAQINHLEAALIRRDIERGVTPTFLEHALTPHRREEPQAGSNDEAR